MEILNISKSEAIRQYPFLKDFHLIPSSDAHDLEAIKGIVHIEMDDISVSALQSALQTQYWSVVNCHTIDIEVNLLWNFEQARLVLTYFGVIICLFTTN